MIRKTVKILVSVALLTTLSMAQKEAIVVGISNYQGQKADLRGIDKDVQKMKSLFEQWGFHVTVLWNEQSMQIGDYLAKYAQDLGKDDAFGLYYSGHGSKTFDKSGDEDDKQDETLVLSDGANNVHFLDDSLFGYLNEIKAKKIVLFDSCHSGTVFKTFGDKPKPKSLVSKSVTGGIMKTKAFRPRQSQLSDGEYIVLSSSQDNEESLATGNGSLFTNAIYRQFTNPNGATTNFTEIKNRVAQEIVDYCYKSKSKVHHPKISASDAKLKYTTISEFLKPKKQEISTTDEKITILSEQRFKEKDILKFKLDTHGNSGYITFLTVGKSGKAEIMHQSEKPMSGVLNFPKDFNVHPLIECYKECGKNCPQEVSRLFAVLSQKPITVNSDATKGLKIDSIEANNFDARAFRKRKASQPIVTYSDFVIE